MPLIAASGLGLAIPIVLILVCPLMMVVMMRGMHGGSGHGGHGESKPKPREQMTLDELKEARDELNAEIGDRASTTRYPPRV